MGRVQPTTVEVWIDGAWLSGTVRTCEVTSDGSTCTAVVSYGGSNAMTTGRFPAERMRKPSGEQGCPAHHRDQTCCP